MSNTHILGELQHINKPAAVVFDLFSDFSRFAVAIPEDKKDQVTITPDSILAKVQGMEMGVQVVNRVPYSLIELQQYGQVPFAFTINVHIMPNADQCDLQLELDAELNMMFKMMLGGKLKEMIDQFGTQLAKGLNNVPVA